MALLKAVPVSVQTTPGNNAGTYQLFAWARLLTMDQHRKTRDHPQPCQQ
jgi:hypothetical protein